MSGIDRTQILRIDCRACKGAGFVRAQTGETSCNACGGTGLEEKEVPYKFDTNGRFTQEEKAEAFGLPIDQISDKGHAEASAPAGDPTE